MTATTRSADKKQTEAQGSSGEPAAGAKHKIKEQSAPNRKRAKKEGDKQQLTLEDTIPSPNEAYGDGVVSASKPKKQKDSSSAETKDAEDDAGNDSEQYHTPDEAEATETGTVDVSSTAVQEGDREQVPSNILEKGTIYFFLRGRVDTDSPSSVSEIQRTYMVLRPIPLDAKLGPGPIGDDHKDDDDGDNDDKNKSKSNTSGGSNSRLLAVPKKVLPQSGRDRWIAFVEKADASFATLRDEFLKGADYETKTAGTRHTPAAQPAAEGVYAITSTGRETHLAYIVTLPSSGGDGQGDSDGDGEPAELGELQTKLGIRPKGSFILSTRNPAYSAPKGTSLPQGPDYSQKVQDSFQSRRWMPTQPEHLDYPKTQVLLIGESSGIQKATEPEKDQDGVEQPGPREELEKLEDEDMQRMRDLEGDDSAAIFADLQVRASQYPKLETAF